MEDRLKLTIDLVPRSSWYANLRTRVSPQTWDRIRKQAYAASGYQCSICGAAQVRLHCHEHWEYDDAARIQRLTGFVALCALCHYVKHLGLAQILAAEGKLDDESVVQHFLRVNACDRDTFAAHAQRAFAQWRERSQHAWTVDFGAYRDLVAEAQPMASAPRRR